MQANIYGPTERVSHQSTPGKFVFHMIRQSCRSPHRFKLMAMHPAPKRSGNLLINEQFVGDIPGVQGYPFRESYLQNNLGAGLNPTCLADDARRRKFGHQQFQSVRAFMKSKYRLDRSLDHDTLCELRHVD